MAPLRYKSRIEISQTVPKLAAINLKCSLFSYLRRFLFNFMIIILNYYKFIYNYFFSDTKYCI